MQSTCSYAAIQITVINNEPIYRLMTYNNITDHSGKKFIAMLPGTQSKQSHVLMTVSYVASSCI